MKRAIVLFLCLLTLPSVAGAVTSIYPGNYLNDIDDVTATSPATNDILDWNGTAWVNRPVFEINEITDVTITGVAEGDNLVYNGTSWKNLPTAYGQMYYHNHTVSLDVETTTAFKNVSGLTESQFIAVVLDGTNGFMNASQAGEYDASVCASFTSNGVETYHFYVGVNGVDKDECAASRLIATPTDIGSACINCLLSLAVGDQVSFMINSLANDTIQFESVNIHMGLDR